VFDLVLDTESLAEWKVHTGRRGQPAFSHAAINACYQLRAMLHLTFRSTEGFMAGLFALADVDPGLAPDFSTLCKRRGDVSFAAPQVEPGGVWLIDGTGISFSSKGHWASKKYGAPRRRFVRVTLTTDATSGAITGVSVTKEEGPGTGEVSQVPELLPAAGEPGPAVLIGDGVYDTAGVYATCRERGVRLITPPRITAQPGLDPDRDAVLRQVGRLGPSSRRAKRQLRCRRSKHWKRRTGYHLRSRVEASIGALKETLGDTTRAHTHQGAEAEVIARVNAYNRWMGAAA
jgi:hypothetical protein